MTFLLFFFFSTAFATKLAIEVTIECKTCVQIGTKCYNITHILDLNAPFRNQIVIHKMGVLRAHEQNVLFYSFEPRIEEEEYYKVGFVNLDNFEQFGVIAAGQKLNFNFGAFDIDQDNGNVYLGGSDGIFVLDKRVEQLMPYSSRGDIISNIFFKSNVYFTRYDDRGVIVKKGDNFKTIFEYILIKKFVINKYDIIVFSTNYGLYVGKGDITHRISKNAFFRGLTIDLEDNVYAWWIDGIYRVIVEKNIVDSKIENILHLPGIGAMTFDKNNNLLFTSEKSLYVMTETSSNCTSIR